MPGVARRRQETPDSAALAPFDRCIEVSTMPEPGYLPSLHKRSWQRKQKGPSPTSPQNSRHEQHPA